MADTDVFRAMEIISAPGDTLTVKVRKEIDFDNLNQDWAQRIVALYPGPYVNIRIDLSQCGRVSSTFYAGMVHLNTAFKPGGCKPVVLFKPDARLVHNLTMLQLNRLFVIEPR